MNLEIEDARYAKGFAAGESCAFRDRRSGRSRIRPMVLRDTYERAFWDGYTPRSSTWARTKVAAWWGESEGGESAEGVMSHAVRESIKFDATQIGASA